VSLTGEQPHRLAVASSGMRQPDAPARTVAEGGPTALPGEVFEECAPLEPIPVEAPYAQCLDPTSPLAEEFRLLRGRVRALDGERSLRALGVVSAGRREGRSTIALGLACALAWERHRVLLVEADQARRGLARRLGLAPAAGLVEWLRQDRARAPVSRLGRFGPYLLPAGTAVVDEGAPFPSSRMTELMEAGRRRFDWVVVDAGPVLGSADTLAVQDVVDGFLCVVRARRTARTDLRRALGALKPGRVRGFVLNEHREFFTRYDVLGLRAQGRTGERAMLDSVRGRP
jgi:Mrp family chromosome partitioning ATPase